jgi:hypothetical protein
MTRLIFIICVASACSGGSGDDGTTPDGAANEPLVNGVPASQYYAQFAHQTTKTGVDGAAAFPQNAQGRNAFLATFFLMPGGNLQLFYAEGEGEVTSTGHSLNIDTTTQKKRSGTWRVDGAQLVLDSFMRCDGILFDDKPALRCTLKSSIVSPDAQERSGMFRKRLGESGPDDSEFAGYKP